MESTHVKPMIINGIDLTHIREEFIRRLPEKISELEDLIDRHDIDAISIFGHKMKGSGSTYGLPELSQIGKRLEQLKEYYSTQELLEAEQQLKNIVKELSHS
jgi:HPt (histidine-containing phosphotransfer) domain-containing protein